MNCSGSCSLRVSRLILSDWQKKKICNYMACVVMWQRRPVSPPNFTQRKNQKVNKQLNWYVNKHPSVQKNTEMQAWCSRSRCHLLPGWSKNVSHTPGGVVRSKVGVSFHVFVGHSDPKFCPVVHLNFPVVLTSHWDQIPQHSYTPAHTGSYI